MHYHESADSFGGLVHFVRPLLAFGRPGLGIIPHSLGHLAAAPRGVHNNRGRVCFASRCFVFAGPPFRLEKDLRQCPSVPSPW